VNNVVYNFGALLLFNLEGVLNHLLGTRVTDGGAHQVDFLHNTYKPGASSVRKYDLQATYEDGLPGTQQACSSRCSTSAFN